MKHCFIGKIGYFVSKLIITNKYNIMKRGWIPIMGVCLVLSFSACKQLLPYQDTSLTAEQRAEDLLPRLTLEEKVSLMQKRHLLSPTGN